MKKTPFPSCQVLPHPPTSYDSYHPTDIHFNHQAPSSLEAFALVGDISFHLAQGMDCHDLVSHLIMVMPWGYSFSPSLLLSPTGQWQFPIPGLQIILPVHNFLFQSVSRKTLSLKYRSY